MVLYLIMPDLYQEITVKVIGLAYSKGDEFFVPVVMWGDPKQTKFEMKLGKTLWNSIENGLIDLEEDPLNGFMGINKFQVDEDLVCLKDRIITVRGIPNSKKPIVKDDKVTYPKIFSAEFQSSLEEAEKAGKEIYKEAVFAYVINRPSCRECRLLNTQLAKETEEKEKEKIKKREEKQIEEQDWVKKKREEKEKEAAKLKQLEFCGWQ